MSARGPGLWRRRLAHALAEQFEEALARQRWRDQHALAEVAAHDQERLQVGHALDALGECRAAEAVRQVNRRLTDCRVVRVVAHR
jgi:hypothetical protein